MEKVLESATDVYYESAALMFIISSVVFSELPTTNLVCALQCNFPVFWKAVMMQLQVECVHGLATGAFTGCA